MMSLHTIFAFVETLITLLLLKLFSAVEL
jgi:hypothetical protein